VARRVPDAAERHVIVVGGGERPPDHVRAEAEEREILAVDAGAHWVLRWGLVPARVIGDLDSLDERSRTYADQYGAPIEGFFCANDAVFSPP
jgi:thiamine pyrophosphokinase